MAGEKLYTVIRNEDSSEYVLFEQTGRTRISTVYVETHVPNRRMLKRMLESAIGRSRTLTQFANDCSDPSKCPMNTAKITVPTLKRILSENEIVRPLKAEVIQALLNNTDDVYTVNGDDLMRANGLEELRLVELAKQEALSIGERLTKEKSFLIARSRAEEDIRRKLSEINRSSKTAWISVPNGTSVKDVPPTNTNRFSYGKEYGFIDPYGLNLAFMEADKKSIRSYWGFYVDGTEPEDEISETNVIRDHYELFLYDVIHPDYFDDMRVSFLCQNQQLYNSAVAQLADYKVSNYMSVVLVQKGAVVAEFTLKNRDGGRPECILGDFCDHYEGAVYDEAVKRDAGWQIKTRDVPVFGY